MKIAVIGLGYVGLVAAACFAELGHDVQCVDSDTEKLAALRRGETPIHERFLPELLKRHAGVRMHWCDSLADGVAASDAVFIAVGTPPAHSGEADLSHVEAVSRQVARAIADSPNKYRIIVGKSTVPVYTSDWVRHAMEINGAPSDSFDVASNPEFLREGTAVTDFLYPDRIVIGANNARTLQLLSSIYEPLTTGSYYRQHNPIPEPDGARKPARLIATSAKSAELIKHASNAFLAMKISFINAVSVICEAVGADIQELSEGIGSDGRVGPRFLNAGIGYGGSCFPKDVSAFREVARECGYEFRLLEEVMRVNDEQRARFMRKVRSALWTLKGKRLAVLGLAFKGGTDDIRESPAIALIQQLLKEGCNIAVYDPGAMEKTKRSGLISGVDFATGPYEGAKGADALLILTDWEEFGQLDLTRLRSLMKYPLIIDGRNLYPPSLMSEQGFAYLSVGRPEVRAAKVVRADTPNS